MKLSVLVERVGEGNPRIRNIVVRCDEEPASSLKRKRSLVSRRILVFLILGPTSTTEFRIIRGIIEVIIPTDETKTFLGVVMPRKLYSSIWCYALPIHRNYVGKLCSNRERVSSTKFHARGHRQRSGCLCRIGGNKPTSNGQCRACNVIVWSEEEPIASSEYKRGFISRRILIVLILGPASATEF